MSACIAPLGAATRAATMSGRDEVPYWVLVSVLTSTFPLEQGLALALHRVALELYRVGGSAAEIEHGLARGQVKNLNQEALLGSVGGPVFEATLETERGEGLVRFLLTRQGIELMSEAPPARRELLN